MTSAMRKKVCIIGGGIVGTSIAYHLRNENVNCTLFEKGKLGSGTSSDSIGGFHMFFGEEWEHDFYSYGWRLYQSWAKDPTSNISFHRTGRLTIAETENEVTSEVLAPAEFTRGTGHENISILSPKETAEFLPGLDISSITKSIYTGTAGYFDPIELIHEFADKAQDCGVKIMTDMEVKEIIVEKDSIQGVVAEDGEFDFDVIINAAGPWAIKVGAMAGVELPLVHTKGQVLVLKPKEEIDRPIPMALFTPKGGYLRDEIGGKIIVGKQVYALDNKLEAGFFDPDRSPSCAEPYFKEFVAREMSSKLPFLSDGEILDEWVGYRTVTPDFVPIIDYSPINGFILSVGYSGRGIILAPMGGRMTARIVTEKPIRRYRGKFQLDRF